MSARMHTCSMCGHVGPWDKGWEWYGSQRDLDDGTIQKVCSPACKTAHQRLRAELAAARETACDT